MIMNAHENHIKYKWTNDAKENFIRQIDLNEVSHIKESIDRIVPNCDSIDSCTNTIATLFEKIAQKTLNPIKKVWNKRPFDKPWFGPECKAARKEYHKARRLYKSNKNEHYKSNLNSQSKNFKKIMNKYIRRHKIDKAKQLRNMQYKNPKEYWKFLNSINKNKKSEKQPTINQFFEHFKNINETQHNQDALTINTHWTDVNDTLNMPITCDEIKKCINKLKNSKSPGCDNILNEYLKSTKEIFLPVY